MEVADRGSKRKRKITEEVIAQYLAKKAHKKAAKKLKLQIVSLFANNESNPFVWRKKIERDIARGVPIDQYSEEKRRRERLAEIEKVKKRREAMAIERAQALLAGERARAEFEEDKKEEQFDFDQSKIRSEIRLREGRAKPIDVLINHLNPLDDNNDINEPSTLFKGLSLRDLEELKEDITKLHLLDIDRRPTAATPTPTDIQQYWEALAVVCDWELREARKRDALERARVPPDDEEEERGMHSSIETEVKTLLRGKSFSELEALQSQIESQMRSGTAKVVEYWEALLKRLRIFKAKAYLKEIHAKILQRPEKPLEEGDRDAKVGSPEPTLPEEAGSFSPELFHVHGDDDEEAIDPEEDKAVLERKRLTVLAMTSTRPPPPPPVHGWQEDKHRPRKPKYLNRVHTGYEWNKYNQTHYDVVQDDNPPPKMVVGYKFNIMYPELDDKGKAPTYSMEEDGDSRETCIIRFHGGPPYGDIAFRIVNKEWEYSGKKGFKSTFERGILQLHFNFKRYRYRR